MQPGDQTLAEQAYEAVETLIVTLALPPGAVFSEAELGARVGIGRTPLREALQRLAGERLIVALPRKGMLVTELNLVDFLALLETRRVLDALIARRAARRATPVHLAALQEAAADLQAAAQAEDLAAFMRADRALDAVLHTAAQNPFASEAAAPLHAHCRRFWYAHRHAGDLSRSAELHQALIDTVSANDPHLAAVAAEAIVDYLLTFTRNLLDLA